MWGTILIYDIKEDAHTLMIIADIFVVIFLIVIYASPGNTEPKIKSVQQVEDEIVQIEMKQKSA